MPELGLRSANMRDDLRSFVGWPTVRKLIVAVALLWLVSLSTGISFGTGTPPGALLGGLVGHLLGCALKRRRDRIQRSRLALEAIAEA